MVQDSIAIAFVLHKLCRGGVPPPDFFTGRETRPLLVGIFHSQRRGGVSPPDFFTGRETRPLLVGIFHSSRRGNYQLPVMAEQAAAATASP